MQWWQQGEVHRPVSLVDPMRDKLEAPALRAMSEIKFSLLRMSVPARLLIVAVAAALLWSAVLWALR